MNTYASFGPKGFTVSGLREAPTAGIMQFAFVDMGQGDCTLISCPDNRLYIVDCGSSGGLEVDPFTNAQELVREWADGNQVYMIMTHPDKDHYNQYINLLVSEPKVPVNCIYFSRAKTDKSPLGAYTQTALGSNLSHFSYPMLVEITLRKGDHYTKKWTKFLGNYKDVLGPIDIPEAGYLLAEGKTPKTNIPWSVTIIAGNVKATSGKTADHTNAASLCTLVKYGEDTLVLTGDSNEDTLKYLYDSHADQIKNAAIFQVPHHGSLTGLPTEKFKNLVNPISLIVSVGLLTDVFRLPRYTVIESWRSCKRLRAADDRDMDFWKPYDEVKGYKNYDDLNGILVKWQGYKVYRNDSGTFFWLKDPADAKKAGTGFYGFTYNGFFLFRENWKKDIWMTGVLGTLDDDFQPTMAKAPRAFKKLIKEKRR